MPFGFRCKGINEPTADKPAENRQKQERPSVEDGFCGFKEMPFPRGRGRTIPGDLIQQEMGPDLTEKMKKDGSQTGDETDQDKIEAPFSHRSDGIGLFL